MKRFFKIRLRMTHGSKELWVGIRARSIGEAIVIADTRTMDTEFEMCADSVKEVSPEEYYRLLNAASFAGNLQA